MPKQATTKDPEHKTSEQRRRHRSTRTSSHEATHGSVKELRQGERRNRRKTRVHNRSHYKGRKVQRASNCRQTNKKQQRKELVGKKFNRQRRKYTRTYNDGQEHPKRVNAGRGQRMESTAKAVESVAGKLLPQPGNMRASYHTGYIEETQGFMAKDGRTSFEENEKPGTH